MTYIDYDLCTTWHMAYLPSNNNRRRISRQVTWSYKVGCADNHRWKSLALGSKMNPLIFPFNVL